MPTPLFDPDPAVPEQDAAGGDKIKNAEESVGALILRLRKYNGTDNDVAGNTGPRIEPGEDGIKTS
jgi:hypothetical protein